MKRLALICCVLVSALLSAGTARAEGPVIYVKNASTTVPQAQVDVTVQAAQIAVSRDLAPAWGTDAALTEDPSVHHDMVVVILDYSDSCGWDGCALGYHENFHGVPTAYVFAATSDLFSEAWTIVFTHELFEMIVDPWTNRFATGIKHVWLTEVCDPVESGFYGYFIGPVAISDFITPHWYGGYGRKDFTGYLTHAEQIGVHGYASYRTKTGGWGQVFG